MYLAQNEDSSQDVILAQGGIEWIDPRLVDYFGHPCNREEVIAGLKAGIWYDPFACLNQLIEADPGDQSLRRLRYRLLMPSGLMPLLDPGIDLLEVG